MGDDHYVGIFYTPIRVGDFVVAYTHGRLFTIGEPRVGATAALFLTGIIFRAVDE